MYHTLYLGLDAHTRTCTLAGMDPSGRVVSTDTFLTSESARIAHVTRIPAKTIYLGLEEWRAGLPALHARM